MWAFTKVFEHNIHLPDITSPVFHCQAKLGPFDYPPQKLVTTGALHPTVQFTNPDLAFFKYPNVHLKIKMLQGDVPHRTGGITLLDGVYPMPPKKLLSNFLSPTGAPTWSSLDYRNVMSKNFLPLAKSWIEMKRICVPPDNVVRRLFVSAVAADSNGKDVLDGSNFGVAVYDFKHKLPWYQGRLVAQLNRGVSFF